MIGGERIEITVKPDADVADAQQILSAFAVESVHVDGLSLVAPISGGATTLTKALRSLTEAGVNLDDVALRRPTLDDVFLSLTGTDTTAHTRSSTSADDHIEAL